VRRRATAAALIAHAAAAVCAEAPAPRELSAEVSVGVLHRRLVERADDGRRLVQESGALLRLQASGALGLEGGGALQGAAAVASGSLDYRGQTQAGAPMNTDAGHRDLEYDLAWRPLAPAGWGQAWLVLHTVRQRRQIASTPAARGLRETAHLVMPGLRWSHAFDAAGWRLRPSVEARVSAWHRLDVDFGGVFDTSELKGGRRRELVLAIDASPAGSPWSIGLAWAHARQSASPVHALTRGGAPVGTVHQPRIEIDDVLLRATRAF
jgi:hypothetical protein